jgi:hypothetical protein
MGCFVLALLLCISSSFATDETTGVPLVTNVSIMQWAELIVGSTAIYAGLVWALYHASCYLYLPKMSYKACWEYINEKLTYVDIVFHLVAIEAIIIFGESVLS